MAKPCDFKILICDDAVTNVMILCRLCESEGFDNIETLTDPRKVMPAIEEAFEHLQAEAGKSFDPALVQLFVDNIDKVKSIHQAYRD